MTLTIYAGGEALAVVELVPLHAIAIAGGLIEAAFRRLTAPAEARRRRGGDNQARRRDDRNTAILDLAQAIGADLSLEELAMRIIEKAGRYRPLPADGSGSAERRALHRVASSGLRVPGRRQLRRILGHPIEALDVKPPEPCSNSERGDACP